MFPELLLCGQKKNPLKEPPVDIIRFQNFWLTLIVVVAYLGTAVAYIGAQQSLANVNALPGLSGTLVNLLAISHAGYLAMKLPDKAPVG